jgi:hypothetical protein
MTDYADGAVLLNPDGTIEGIQAIEAQRAI